MADFMAKIGVSNQNKRPHVVWVEPWAEDFTLLPGEELEIRASSTLSQPWFHVVESDGHTQVYIETIYATYEVLQHGNPLQCGHNRQSAVDAGLSL